jgi:lipoprotein LpqH
MRRPIVIATGFAMCLAAVAGCSSQDSGSPTKSGQGRVTFGPNDAGPVSSVSCETKDGLTTIGIKGKMPASVVLTDGEAPVVQ